MPARNPLTFTDLAEIGKVVYGVDWRPALAGWLNVSIDTMKSWSAGRRQPQDLEQYRAALIDLLEAHGGKVQGMLRRLQG